MSFDANLESDRSQSGNRGRSEAERREFRSPRDQSSARTRSQETLEGIGHSNRGFERDDNEAVDECTPISSDDDIVSITETGSNQDQSISNPTGTNSREPSLTMSLETLEKKPSKSIWKKIKEFLKSFQTPKWLLLCLCLSAIVQGMIFTNVVISSIERRFGLQSTQSGFIAGSYDIGSLLAVIPVTYLGGRPGASKPKYIAIGMFIMGTGSLLFASPHFVIGRYIDTLDPTWLEETNIIGNVSSASKSGDKFLCRARSESSNQTTCGISQKDGIVEEELLKLSNYQYVFILAQLLHGIGAAALTTLGTTLIDESVSRKSSPMYIGIFEASFVLGPALGYVVGGRLLNIFTEFYLMEGNSLVKLHEQLPIDSPNWIGAWWIGFLLILGLSYVFAILLTLFPSDMKHESAILKEKKKPLHHDSPKDTNYFGLLKALPKALHSLLSNATYMFISFGATMDGFLMAGMAAFLPKYFESQFQLSPGDAAMLVGAIVVPAGAGGALIGGYVAKRLKLSRKGSIQMYMLCQAIILPLYLGFLLYCPNTHFAGLNSQQTSDTDTVLSVFSGSSPTPNFVNECNSDCDCSLTDFEPVCSTVDQVTYFSPCFAGCKTKRSNESALFMDCSCLGSSDRVTRGQCKTDQCQFALFALILFFQVFFTFAAALPGLIASLRSVEHSERSLSLGLQTILLRGFGTIPGPIVFGYVMDQTCILWRTQVNGDSSPNCSASTDLLTEGSCLIYDNFMMSIFVLIITVIWRFAGLVLFGLALYVNKYSKVKDEDEDDEMSAVVINQNHNHTLPTAI